jgi:hypothetical protein
LTRMTDSPGDRRTKVAELTTAAGLLLWRILAIPLPVLWRDWISLLSIYWIFTVFVHRGKAWPYVTAAAMILLTALYIHGQSPHTLDALGIRR